MSGRSPRFLFVYFIQRAAAVDASSWATRSDGLWARTTDESDVGDAQPFPKRGGCDDRKKLASGCKALAPKDTYLCLPPGALPTSSSTVTITTHTSYVALLRARPPSHLSRGVCRPPYAVAPSVSSEATTARGGRPETGCLTVVFLTHTYSTSPRCARGRRRRSRPRSSRRASGRGGSLRC